MPDRSRGHSSRVTLDWPEASTLLWRDGALFDVASGWSGRTLDGDLIHSSFTPYGSGFDTVVESPRGDVVALVASTGTKALLLHGNGRLLREVDRSYYCAHAYRYPLALFTLPDGRTGLVHCPTSYDRLEVEAAETGERLTADGERQPQDYFHSRLAVSEDGTRLLSAGWFWHPVATVQVHDLGRAAADPRVLDADAGPPLGPGWSAVEVAGACFAGPGIVVSTADDESEREPDDVLGANELAGWSEAEGRYVWRQRLDFPAGDLLTVADGAVLAVHRYPRLFDAATGDLLEEWPDLLTGPSDSPLVGPDWPSGAARVGIEPGGHRFAVTDGERVQVVTLVA